MAIFILEKKLARAGKIEKGEKSLSQHCSSFRLTSQRKSLLTHKFLKETIPRTHTINQSKNLAKLWPVPASRMHRPNIIRCNFNVSALSFLPAPDTIQIIPDPGKSSGSNQIGIRIQNTSVRHCLNYVQILKGHGRLSVMLLDNKKKLPLLDY